MGRPGQVPDAPPLHHESGLHAGRRSEPIVRGPAWACGNGCQACPTPFQDRREGRLSAIVPDSRLMPSEGLVPTVFCDQDASRSVYTDSAGRLLAELTGKVVPCCARTNGTCLKRPGEEAQKRQPPRERVDSPSQQYISRDCGYHEH